LRTFWGILGVTAITELALIAVTEALQAIENRPAVERNVSFSR
jgi:hypothetical protein